MLKIIDRDFNFLGAVDDYVSFLPNKSFHGVGSFELHLHEDSPYANKLLKENIIFTKKNQAYIILFRDLKSSTGMITIKGLEIKAYLRRWLVFPPKGMAYYRLNDYTETIIKTYVQATLLRKDVSNIVVAEDKQRGDKMFYQSRFKNLAEEIEKLSTAGGLGWDITLDLNNKRFVFDVIEGRNLTVNQDNLPPAIFSIEYDNIAEQSLIESRMDYSNTAIVAGQGEGVDRAIDIVGEAKEGLDSFELFVDARDIEDDKDLRSRGLQKLSEVEEILTFDSQILADQNLIYGEDFRLGDIVTVQNSKWNITSNRRLVQINETYESGGFRLDVDFGDNLPTIMDKVRQLTDTHTDIETNFFKPLGVNYGSSFILDGGLPNSIDTGMRLDAGGV